MLFVYQTKDTPVGVLLVTKEFKFTVVKGQTLLMEVLLITGEELPALQTVPKVYIP